MLNEIIAKFGHLLGSKGNSILVVHKHSRLCSLQGGVDKITPET